MTHQFSEFNEYCKSSEECDILEAYSFDCKNDISNYELAYNFINKLLDRAGLPKRIGEGKFKKNIRGNNA